MPHRRDVEAAAEAERLGEVREMHPQHRDVGDDLVALVLEMVLREPERVVAVSVHAARQRLGFPENADKLLVRVTPVVGGRRILAHVAEIDVAGEERVEPLDHVGRSFCIGSSLMVHVMRPNAKSTRGEEAA